MVVKTNVGFWTRLSAFRSFIAIFVAMAVVAIAVMAIAIVPHSRLIPKSQKVKKKEVEGPG